MFKFFAWSSSSPSLIDNCARVNKFVFEISFLLVSILSARDFLKLISLFLTFSVRIFSLNLLLALRLFIVWFNPKIINWFCLIHNFPCSWLLWIFLGFQNWFYIRFIWCGINQSLLLWCVSFLSSSKAIVTVSAIFIYPIRSCRSISIPQAPPTSTVNCPFNYYSMSWVREKSLELPPN